MLDEGVDGFRTIQIGERDAHDPKSVLRQFTVWPAEGLELDHLVRIALRYQHRIQHVSEGIQAALALALLEQRPTVLVEALAVERGRRPDLDDRFVSRLSLGIRLVRKQPLA